LASMAVAARRIPTIRNIRSAVYLDMYVLDESHQDQAKDDNMQSPSHMQQSK
jgi:hypothetical protein